GFHGARHDTADPDVVEEDQRLRPVDEEVVDAHRDQVDPDGVVTPGEERHPELGADTVGRRHEDGIAVSPGRPKEARDRADVAECLGAIGRARPRREPPDCLLAGADIDPSAPVAEAAPDGVTDLRAGPAHSSTPRNLPSPPEPRAGGWRGSNP